MVVGPALHVNLYPGAQLARVLVDRSMPAGEHTVDHDTDGIKICGGIHPVRVGFLFRWGIEGRSDFQGIWEKAFGPDLTVN